MTEKKTKTMAMNAQRNAARLAIYGGPEIESGNDELRRFLAFFDLTQTEMGRILRVPPRSIHLWVNDKDDIPDPVLLLLRLQFRMTPAEGWVLSGAKRDAKKREAHWKLYKELQRQGRIPPGQGIHAARMAKFAGIAAIDKDPEARKAVAMRARQDGDENAATTE